jgi:vacuolar-type H+-ATPase subunit F/Vma7
MRAIRVIGDRDTVLAFALGGVRGVVTQTPSEARAALRTVVEEVRAAGGVRRHPTLVVVTRTVADGIRADIDAATLDAAGPLVLEVPAVHEPRGERRSRSLVERVLHMRL